MPTYTHTPGVQEERKKEEWEGEDDEEKTGEDGPPSLTPCHPPPLPVGHSPSLPVASSIQPPSPCGQPALSQQSLLQDGQHSNGDNSEWKGQGVYKRCEQ